MSTIEHIVTEHITGEVPEGLVAALQERERKAIESLQLYAERFGLMQPVVSRVILALGLGDPDDATKALVEQQYQAFLEEQKAAAERQIAALRAMGMPVPEYSFVDPMTVPLDTSVPDAPPEG